MVANADLINLLRILNIMGKDNLVSSKEAAGRPQDLLDLEKLRSI